MMKSVATVATLVLVALATQPALAQDKKATKGDTETKTVAGLPTFPTDLEALLAMREKWGTEPSMSSPQGSSGSADKSKSK